VDFAHLTERAMLYVVFRFGEMIIGLSGYFEGLFSLNSLYFSLMAFLIVVALFLSYGVLYDRIVDRERRTNGLVYMFLHIFIIFALNNITNALEFMQEEEVALLPKMLFLTISFLLYFAFLLAAGGLYARKERRPNRRFLLRLAGMAVLFTACMIVLREYMKVNIAISVLFVYAVFGILYRFGKAMDAPEGGRS
jgi:low temperature requirement protein LtrA